MRTRTELTCRYCGNKYSRKEHHDRHVRTHTRERPFECAQCGATFARRDTWRRHLRACHAVTDPQCTSGAATAEAPLEQNAAHAPPPNANSATADDFELDFAAPGFETMWQWDESLQLDPGFTMEDLGTYDMLDATPGHPWLPLHPPSEPQRQQQPCPPAPKPRRWFTSPLSHVEVRSDQQAIVSAPVLDQGLDVSRDALASSLKQQIPDTTLPSTRFLNRCIHIFSTRLWHLIPIVHLPTFYPAQANPLLLLSICSLGALAEGSQDALYQAERLHKAVHKAILVSTRPEETSPIEQTLAALQAAAIGQTYALLSGKPSDMMIFQLFHGTLGFAAAALEKALPRAHLAGPSTTSEASTGQDWKAWIQTQSVIRLLNAVHLHSGEISSIVHMPSALRAKPLRLQTAAPDAMFLAKTQAEWVAVSARKPIPGPPAAFSLCAIVESFISETGHARATPITASIEQNIQDILNLFCTWLNDSIHLLTIDGVDGLSIVLLCHTCFIQMLCDIDLFEKVCGRDDTRVAADDAQKVKDWAATVNATRAAIHARFVKIILDRFRVIDVPAIHVARASWHAGLTLAMFSFYAPAEYGSQAQEAIDIFPEFRIFHKAEYYNATEWNAATCDITHELCGSLSFAIVAVLRHLGPWQNAVHYAELLGHVIS